MLGDDLGKSAQAQIKDKLKQIHSLLKECGKIADSASISFVPIKELFTRYDAAEAFWNSSDVCW